MLNEYFITGNDTNVCHMESDMRDALLGRNETKLFKLCQPDMTKRLEAEFSSQFFGRACAS